MKHQLRYFSVILFIGITTAGIAYSPHKAYAQYSADLDSPIYKNINIWEGRGYVRQLPIFRPLPETVLVDIMRQVMRVGDPLAKQKAQQYFKQLTAIYLSSDMYFFNYMSFVSDNGKKKPFKFFASGSFEGNFLSFFASPLVSISVGFAAKPGVDKQDGIDVTSIRNLYSGYRYRNRIEEIPDSFKIGTLGGYDLKGFFQARTSFAVGKPHVFMQAGLMRRSIGPFFDDGLLVSSRAPQTGNLFVHWRGKKLAATWGLFMLTSKQLFNKFNNPNDFEENGSLKFNKVFFYNSLSWYITPNIEFNIFETVTFGDFNFAYLLPIKIIYAIDGLSSFIAGNLLTGFSFDFRIADTIKIPLSLVVDDINVNDLIRFKLDTKLKLALQTGLTWTPKNSIIEQLKFDYQLVLPYTYSHSPGGETLYTSKFNTTNQTVSDEHLATSLDPSSHRLTLELKLSPIDPIEVGVAMRFTQHSNPSEGILKGPKNDGSIHDDGYYSSIYDEKTGPSFQNRNDFLQETIEHTIEPTVFFGVRIPVFAHTTLYADISYNYRYIINYNLKPGVNHSEHNLIYYLGFKVEDF